MEPRQEQKHHLKLSQAELKLVDAKLFGHSADPYGAEAKSLKAARGRAGRSHTVRTCVTSEAFFESFLKEQTAPQAQSETNGH